MADIFSGLYRNAEIVEAIGPDRARLVFAVPTPDEAELLWGDGFLATAPLDGSWGDAQKAAMLEGLNVVVLGDCAGLEKALKGQAKTVKHVNLPSVKVWHAAMPPDGRVQAIKDFVRLLLDGKLSKAGEKLGPQVDVVDLLGKVAITWHNLSVAFLGSTLPASRRPELHSKAVLLLEAASRLVEATKAKES